MTETEALARIRELFEWWKAPESQLSVAFSSEFKFESGSVPMTSDEWLWWVRQNPGWGDVQLVGLVASSAGGAIVFLATDPVTDLRHRIAWLVEWSAISLDRIVMTNEIVPPEDLVARVGPA